MKHEIRARPRRTRIPKRLASYFQEYKLNALDVERDANTIIQRTLEFGTWRELQWLFRVYGKKRITRFVSELGERGLSRVTFNYWKNLLGVRTRKNSLFAIDRSAVWPYS